MPRILFLYYTVITYVFGIHSPCFGCKTKIVLAICGLETIKIWDLHLRDLQFDPEPAEPTLTLVDHVGHLPEPEDLLAFFLGVDLRIIPALRTISPDDHLFLRGPPYLNVTAFLAERPQAIVAVDISRPFMACATVFYIHAA